MRLLVTASQHFGAADIFSLTLFGLLAYAAFPRPAGIGMAVLGLPIATTGNFFPVLYGLLFIWAAPRHNPALKSIAMTGLGLLLVLVGHDPLTGQERFAFRSPALYDGFDAEVIGLGLLGIGLIMWTINRRAHEFPVVPFRYFYPAALFLICIVTYSVNNSLFGVMETLVIGLAGLALMCLGFQPVFALSGFVLGAQLEDLFRRAVIVSHYDVTVFVTRPISAIFLTLCCVLVGAQIFNAFFRKKAPLIKGVRAHGH